VRRDAAAVPVALDDPQVALGAAVAISGYDAGAPRAIELWRIAGARAVRIAIGTSRADGSLDLPPFVMPAGDVTLVAAPRGAGASSTSASAPVVASRDPSSPRLVQLGEVSDASVLVTLDAAEPGGSIVVADAAQQEIGRTPVGATPRLEIAVAVAANAAEVLVAQEVPDGRRSPWRSVAIVQPQGE
jgi:hypothetical protein